MNQQLEILQEKTEKIIPCQLGKKPNCPCSLICAFENNCPVYYVNEHNGPIFKKDNYI